jgi:polar amino acid transport system substrate-binding protein
MMTFLTGRHAIGGWGVAGPVVGVGRARAALAHAALALAAVALVALVFVACGDDGPSAGQKSAEEILGHPPVGVAQEVLDRGTVVVATDADYKPQSWIDPDTKEPKGFDVDVAGRVAELLGVEAEFVHPNWDAISSGLKSGRFDVDIGSLPADPADAKTIAYTDPYYYTIADVAVPKGAAKLDAPDKLAGTRIGVAAQTTSQAYLQKLGDVTVVPYGSVDQAVEALGAGKVDGVMASDLALRAAIVGGEPVELSGGAYFYEPLAFAIRPGEADWLALLNATIATMKGDGSLTDLSQSWYGGHDATRTPAAEVPTFREAMKDAAGSGAGDDDAPTG